jgi:hypothetical protein
MAPEVNITLSTGPTFAWQSANFWLDANGRTAILARYWTQVNRAKAKGAECWLWTGSTNGRGYGLFYVVGKQRIFAHRLAWLISRGDIPKGQEVCHRCDNGLCINPEHLFLGSHRDNHLDSVRKGRKRVWGLQKLDARQVEAIRARVAAGELQRLVAAAFGISRNHVSSIVHRTSWAHLPVHAAQSAPAIRDGKGEGY